MFSKKNVLLEVAKVVILLLEIYSSRLLQIQFKFLFIENQLFVY